MDRPHKSLQEDLITLLCHSPEHGRLVANMATAELFEGDYRVIAERALDYWRTYRTAPASHTPNLLSDILESGDKREPTFRRMLLSMASFSGDGMNPAYVLRRLRTFIRVQTMKGTILAAADRLQNEDEDSVADVEDMLAQVSRSTDALFDPGIRLSDYERLLRWMERPVEFDTGIAALDQGGIVPERGTMLVFLASTNKGKSWWLVHLGKRALLRRKRVLHITLDMGDVATLMRYYQALYSIPRHAVEFVEQRGTLLFDADDHISGFGEADSIRPQFTLASPELELELSTRIRTQSYLLDNIIIKQFPRGSLSVAGLRAYLDRLQSVERFVPELLLIDYPRVMKVDAKDLRISLGQVFVDLSALLVERDMAGGFVHQLSREGGRASTGKMVHVGEDWSVVQTADNIVVYSQTDAEQRLGLARLHVDKARSQAGQFGVLLTQNYGLGQFVLQSGRLPARYWDMLRPENEGEPESES